MKIKIIALDIDGTTLTSGLRLTWEVENAIRTALDRGIFVVPCSGRAFNQLPESILRIEQLQYAIAASGALLYDLGNYNQIIYDNPIAPETIQKLFKIIDRRDIMVESYIAGKPHCEKYVLDHIGDYGAPANYHNFFRDSNVPVASHEEFVKMNIEGRIEKINVFCPTMELRQELVEKIQENCEIKIASALGSVIEMTGKTADKGDGLKHLCSRLDVDPRQVMAVGDSNNDTAMLNFAGVAVAMGNSADEVKQHADFVTTSNDDNGVAKAIRWFI